MAAGNRLVSMPSDTFPFLGVEVWRRTTSGGRLVAKSRGTSERRMGKYLRSSSLRTPSPTKGVSVMIPSRRGHPA